MNIELSLNEYDEKRIVKFVTQIGICSFLKTAFVDQIKFIIHIMNLKKAHSSRGNDIA